MHFTNESVEAILDLQRLKKKVRGGDEYYKKILPLKPPQP